MQTDILIRKDNRDALREMPENAIDLIYADPPFNTGRDFAAADGGYTDKSPMASQVIMLDPSVDFSWLHDVCTPNQLDYYRSLLPTLLAIERVLKPTGAFYYHCDWRTTPHIRWGLCLIFPLSLFRDLSGLLSFPPLILALNIIIPYSVGMLGYLLFRCVSVPNKLALFRAFLMSNFQKASLLEKLFNLLFFVCIGTALTPLLELLEWHPDPFLRLVLVLGTFVLAQKLLSPVPKTPVYYASVGFACVWLAVRSTPSVPAFLTGFAFFLGLYFIVFIIAKQLVLSLASLTLEHAVDVRDLQIGMIPAEQIVRVSQPDSTVRYERKQVEFSGGHDDNIVISPDPAGLDTEKIAQLQHLAAEGALTEFGNQIRIQPAIRFAPMISVGALLTILCQGPFYLKLMQLF